MSKYLKIGFMEYKFNATIVLFFVQWNNCNTILQVFFYVKEKQNDFEKYILINYDQIIFI